MNLETVKDFFKQILQFLTNKKFIFNLLGMLLVLLLILFLVIQWLKMYTNHGQKLQMPNYIDNHIDEALEDANARTFQMIVNDSVHIVGKPGGIIQNQNPKGGAEVKENRKIYVTITKYKADVVDIASVFPLYGQDYESKKNQLQQKAIATEIKEFKYDNLTTGSILEVWNGDEMIISRNLNPKSYSIERGSKLEFVISTPEGGSFRVPDLIGKTVQSATWLIESNKFKIGSVTYANDLGIDDVSKAIIVSQFPESDGVNMLTTGESIDIVVKSPE